MLLIFFFICLSFLSFTFRRLGWGQNCLYLKQVSKLLHKQDARELLMPLLPPQEFWDHRHVYVELRLNLGGALLAY